MLRVALLSIALVSATFALPTEALADEGGWRNLSRAAVRYNRLGLSIFNDTGYRVPLSKSKHKLLKDTYVEAGLQAQASPASLHLGGYFETVPVAPIKLRLSITQLRYFGTYTAIADFQSTDAEWNDDILDEIEDEGLAEHGTGWQAEARVQLRLKFGKVVLLHENRISYLRTDAVAADSAWYETTADVLVGQEDMLHLMYSTLGYVLWGDTKKDFLMLALRHERTTTVETEVERQVLLGAILYRPSKSSWFWEAKPTFGVLGGGYLQDEYREGEPMLIGFLAMEWK